MSSAKLAAAVKAADKSGDPERLALKYQAMRADRFAFFRATCFLFYAHLPALGALRRAPAAWCCGDLHLENFGVYRDQDNLSVFDLTDFDEALLAPAVWDPLRGAASIIVARKTLRFSKSGARRHARLFIDSYAEALAAGGVGPESGVSEQGIVAGLIATLRGRSRAQLLARRTVTVDGAVKLITGQGNALPAGLRLRARAHKLFAAAAAEAFPPGAPDQWGAPVIIIDAARRIAGLGSLGEERYVLLVEGSGGSSPLRLIDLKLAQTSSSVKQARVKQPAWKSEADRIVTVERAAQAASPAFLTSVKAGRNSYIMRELQPREDRFSFGTLASRPRDVAAVLALMGRCAAKAQLRAASFKGAADVAALRAFGVKSAWRGPLAEAARRAARRSSRDWTDYCAAYDAGAFGRG